MKIIIAHTIAIVALLLTSCATPEIVATSDNTYVISGSSHFSSGMAKKAEIIKMANNFAEQRGKVAVAISLKESHPAVGHAGQFEYQFKLADPGSPEANNDIYSELIKYDDLRKRGIISEDEFQSAKKRILEK